MKNNKKRPISKKLNLRSLSSSSNHSSSITNIDSSSSSISESTVYTTESSYDNETSITSNNEENIDSEYSSNDDSHIYRKKENKNIKSKLKSKSNDKKQTKYPKLILSLNNLKSLSDSSEDLMFKNSITSVNSCNENEDDDVSTINSKMIRTYEKKMKEKQTQHNLNNNKNISKHSKLNNSNNTIYLHLQSKIKKAIQFYYHKNDLKHVEFLENVTSILQYPDKCTQLTYDYLQNVILNEHCQDYIKNSWKDKKQKVKNERIFKKLSYKSFDSTNEISYYRKISIDEQKKLIKKLRRLTEMSNIFKPYRIQLLQSEIPDKCKLHAFLKINLLESSDPTDSEYSKTKLWIDSFMRIPFGKYASTSITLKENGIDECHHFVCNAMNELNNSVYGLNEMKMQLLEYLGKLLVNPNSTGSSIALWGPPGCGKTTLIKDGVSKILGRPFEFIPLGGATDSSFLEGYSYTYEGSFYGRIIQTLIRHQCMNPIIYFDELDKVSDSGRGKEIINVLIHLTDTSQNTEFQDRYFSDIKFDVSKCLFIFSYNDEDKIHPILKDRLYQIKTNTYTLKDKLNIARNYLIPSIQEEIKFSTNDIIFTDEILEYINSHYTQNELGVRNFKRCLEKIHTKINLIRLIKPDEKNNIFSKEILYLSNITFPVTITHEMINKMLTKPPNEEWKNFYT